MPFVPTSSNEDHFSTMQRYFEELKFCDTISSKMRRLYELSSLTSQDLQIRNELRVYIQRTLQQYYPFCQVFIYGSSNNGFGTKDCDIDLLFLPYPEYCRLGSEKDDDDEEYVPSLEQVAEGIVPKPDLLQMGEKSQLLFTKQVLKSEPWRFHRIVFIPAKCPILNFIFNWKKSKFFCDLSCRNRLVLYNTQLLKFFGMIDSRVMPLVFTLRCWAKCVKHVQVLNFSTYAFTLMIIFFLQSVDPPVLPSVDYLMNISGSFQVVAEWEVGFAYDISKVPKSANNCSNEELFEKFFDFYWNFDFNKNIVCVRSGHALPIKCIGNTFDDKCKSFEITAVCIQDPFKLSHNVSRNVKHNGLRNFKLSFLIAMKILKEIPVSPSANCNFDLLFDESNFKVLINDFHSVSTELSTSLIFDLDYEIMSTFENVNPEKTWYCNVSKAVLDILSQGLLFECEVVDRTKSPFEKDILRSLSNEACLKNCTLKDMDSVLAIQCAVYSRVWVARKTATTGVLPELATEFSDIIEKEEYISKRITADPLFSNPTPLFWFLCYCYKSKFPQIPCLIMEFTPLTKSIEFKSMVHFLSTFLPKTLRAFYRTSELADIAMCGTANDSN